MSWLFKQLQPDSQNDIVILSESLNRQLRGVVDFIAPPPTTTAAAAELSPELPSSSSEAIAGIRNDLAEITGSFKNSLSLISSNKAISEISKFASNLLNSKDNDDEDEESVGGIDEDVIEFARKVAQRPELWTEFPLELDNDFHMSDVQELHASTIQDLVPEFASLRAQLDTITDERFWLIYFVLLLPRLDEEDSEVLLSPKIIQTRDILLQKLQNKEVVPADNSENSLNASQNDDEVSITLKDENPIQGGDSFERLRETDKFKPAPHDAQNKLDNEDDISFSDLEDDDNDLSARLAELKHRQDSRPSSSSESSEWVRLNSGAYKAQGCSDKARQSISRDKYSSGEESSDWLAVDEF